MFFMRSKMIFKVIFWMFLIVFFLLHSSVKANVRRIIFNADVVASACHVVVDTGVIGDNTLAFDIYRKSTGGVIPARKFTIRLYESGSSIQGCSAFLAGQLATLQFGSVGQLDSHGVVTQGAGDGIRIEVRAIDSQADYREHLTERRNTINYPITFASKGQFCFEAKPIIPADVNPGEYSGALSFIISYH